MKLNIRYVTLILLAGMSFGVCKRGYNNCVISISTEIIDSHEMRRSNYSKWDIERKVWQDQLIGYNAVGNGYYHIITYE